MAVLYKTNGEWKDISSSSNNAVDVVDAVENGNMKPVTSNAVYVALNNQSVAGGSDWASVAGLSGRNLLDVLNVSSVSAAAQALKAKSDAKDYSGLRLGDYLEITATYGEYGSITAKYEIAAMGQYNRFYNGSSFEWGLGSITFLSSRILFKRQIGTSADQRQYFTSPMNTLLTGTIAPAIEGVLGVKLKRPVLFQQYNINTYEAPSWDADASYNDARTSPKVFLPSQREFFGEAGFSSPYWDNSHQFPLLANVPGKIPAKNQSDSFSMDWTRSPSVIPGYFCNVSPSGHSGDFGAGSSAGGVRPAFNL